MKILATALCLLAIPVVGQELTEQEKIKNKEIVMEMISPIGVRIHKQAKKIENASIPELINIVRNTSAYDAQRAAAALHLLNKPLTPDILDVIFEVVPLKMQSGLSESVDWYVLHPVAAEVASKDELLGEIVRRSIDGLIPDSITQGLLLDYQSRGVDVKKYLQELMNSPLSDYPLRKCAYLIDRLDGKSALDMPPPNDTSSAVKPAEATFQEGERSSVSKKSIRLTDRPLTENVEDRSHLKLTVTLLCSAVLAGFVVLWLKKKAK
jgi:hypothetical protein